MTDAQHVADAFDRAYAGGPDRHKEKSAQQGQLPVRERVHRLLDDGSSSEDALLASWVSDGRVAAGVVTARVTIAVRTVAPMGIGPSVKAGAWGPKTVEKTRRIQERALAPRVRMVCLFDSVGA